MKGFVWLVVVVNRESFRLTMQNLWRLQSKEEFGGVGNNLFVVKFQDALDLQRVQDGRHWTFNRNLIYLTNYDRSLTSQQINFRKEPMWVQLHNILLCLMNRSYDEKLGKITGDVMDIDVDKDQNGLETIPQDQNLGRYHQSSH